MHNDDLVAKAILHADPLALIVHGTVATEHDDDHVVLTIKDSGFEPPDTLSLAVEVREGHSEKPALSKPIHFMLTNEIAKKFKKVSILHKKSRQTLTVESSERSWRKLYGKELRVLGPRDPIPEDHNSDRVTVIIDKDGKIIHIGFS